MVYKNFLKEECVSRIVLKFILWCSCALLTTCSFATQNLAGIQVYQKNLAPEHKQKLADDITRYRNADNLWDVLREDFTLPHYEDNPIVQEKIEWFMNNQDYLLRSATRAAPYLYYILQQVKQRHLPAELVLLPIIESGYNPFAISSVGAKGIWQMMPDTATGLGIKQDWWYDGRQDVIASTRAALTYLAYLQSFFDGNWLLAIAAYNTGEGNVLAAIRRNIRDGKKTVFWSLPVAQQTRDYVPSILALATIISHPNQYPIYFPPVRNAPYLAQVDIGKQINLKYAASLAGLSYQKLIQLNPGLIRATTAKTGPSKLVLPIENIEQFAENLARSPLNQKINWTHYKVRAGDNLLSIAKKFDTTPIAIRKLNHLANNTIRSGAQLLIPHNKAKLIMEDSGPTLVATEQKSDKKYTLQPGDTIYMIRDKDSLVAIAKRFQVSKTLLAAVNQLNEKKMIPGKQIIIPTHSKLAGQTNLALTRKLHAGDTIYMVKHGDTIEKIAHKFKITASAIRVLNLVDNSSLNEGDKIIIPSPLRG